MDPTHRLRRRRPCRTAGRPRACATPARGAAAVLLAASTIGLAAWPAAAQPVPASPCHGLSGRYGGGAGIVVGPDRLHLTVTMPGGRPLAHGSCRGDRLRVLFPDDAGYTGVFDGQTIRWSNATSWQRVADGDGASAGADGAGRGPARPVPSASGPCNGVSGLYSDAAVLVVGADRRTVSIYPGAGRPLAHGHCTGDRLRVTFPDDATYSARFDGRRIGWTNNTLWIRR